MKIRKNFVQLDSEDIKMALAKYARELHEKEFGYTDFSRVEVKLTIPLYAASTVHDMDAEVRFTKRQEQMPLWAQELRAALKPLVKNGVIYINRRKGYLSFKIHLHGMMPERKACDFDAAWGEVNKIVQKHMLHAKRVQANLFRVGKTAAMFRRLEQCRANEIIEKFADADMSQDEVFDLLVQNGISHQVATGIAQDMRPE